LGEYQRAIEFHQQSLAIDREIGDRHGEAVSLGNLGIVYESLGKYQRAREFHQQSLAIDREIGSRHGEAHSLGNLGNVYNTLGESQRAIELYQQSLAIYRELGDPRGEASSFSNLGNVYNALGESQRAMNFHQQSFTIFHKLGDRQGEATSLNNLGYALLKTEQFSQAEIVFKQSIEVYESLRTDLPDNQLISLADTQGVAYANLEHTLIAQGKPEAALAITERGRGRAFVLQLASRLSESTAREALANNPIVEAPNKDEIQQIARDTNTTIVTYSAADGFESEFGSC
jgi:tetratricopeptide (TPR) repeat protein